MPVLHAYTDRPGWYLVTAIDGGCTTFQLHEAARYLLQLAGYAPDDDIPHPLFFQLWEHGFAFTARSGRNADHAAQPFEIALDPGDSAPAITLPHCDCCPSYIRLHLVQIRSPSGLKAEIACDQCFHRYGVTNDELQRVYLESDLSVEVLHLLASITHPSPNVSRLGALIRFRRSRRLANAA